MRRQKHFTLGVLALLLAVSLRVTVAQSPPPEENAQRVDPKADQVLRAMGDFCKGLKSASVEVTTSYSGQLGRHVEKVMTNDMTFALAIERPNRFAKRLTKGKMPFITTIICDGSKTYTYSPYFGGREVVDIPVEQSRAFPRPRPEGTIALDGWFLLDRDPYGSLTKRLKSGQYVGLEETGSSGYHHLRFSEAGAMLGQKEMSWDMWVQAGATPLVSRVVIVPAEKRIKHTEPPIIFETLEKITHSFVNWKIDVTLPQDTFAIPEQ